MIRHQKRLEGVPPITSPASSHHLARRIKPGLLLVLSFTLLALVASVLLSLLSEKGELSVPLGSPSQLTLTEKPAAVSPSDFGPHLGTTVQALATADTQRSELPFHQRGKPDSGTLPPALLLIGLGLVLRQLSLGTQHLEDDAPRVKLRICRPRPPTFRPWYR